jgi:tetratricopeptide (TPR) repeat protein
MSRLGALLRWTAVLTVAVVACVAAAVALRPGQPAATTTGPVDRPSALGAASAASATGAGPVSSSDALSTQVAMLQRKLRTSPGDAAGWATLGIDYVQLAKDTVNPLYYPRAAGALRASLRLDRRDNFVAMVGMADLRAAQHRFRAALDWARRAARIDPYSSGAQGAIADAATQLGRYDLAARAVQRMVNLRPGTPSLARASYVLELRGDVAGAIALMRRALDDAATPAERAFAHYYLGELERNAGDPRDALREQELGQRADPTYPDLLEGKARAEAALGMRSAAVRDYAAVIARAPQPAYLIEAGEYFQSIGERIRAAQAYRLFEAENRLFEANGVQLDTDPTLYYADHGRPRLALRAARVGIRIRPFLEMADAYAWALHVNHRDRAALRWSRRARATGLRSALLAFHAGMIERALGMRRAAVADLAAALRINPAFDPLRAPVARRALRELRSRS